MTSNPFQEKARELAVKFAPRASQWDKTRSYCWDNVADLTGAGLMGMTLPTEYGGQGASFHDTCWQSRRSPRPARCPARIVVEANMGAISAIMAYGSEEQKAFCAPIVLSGDKPAICITEPEAGSAATEMTTTARKVGSAYRITGRKHWITGGGVSRLHLIFAGCWTRTARNWASAASSCIAIPSAASSRRASRSYAASTRWAVRHAGSGTGL